MTTKKEKLVKRGIKKIFSLTRTKIRLGREADTEEVKPNPLPLVKTLTGKEIETVDEAEELKDKLREDINYEDKKLQAKTILQLIDIIEGVKYKFEPDKYCFQLSEKKLKEIEKRSREENLPVNILLMTEKTFPGINLFIGEDGPEGVTKLSAVPSSVALFLDFAFHSEHFSQDLELKNITSVFGRKTLILNAIHFSLGQFGAELKEEEG